MWLQTGCRDAPWHVSTNLNMLFHHQFLGRHGTVLLNDVDEIDALVPFGGIDADGLALGFVHLLSDKVIHLHLGHIRAFHGELARSRVGIDMEFGRKFSQANIGLNPKMVRVEGSEDGLRVAMPRFVGSKNIIINL